MQTLGRMLAVLGLLSIGAEAAQAQYWRVHEGPWLSVGLSYGSANVSCDSCVAGPRTSGVAGFLGLGGTVSSHVRLGGGVHAWWHSDGTATETLSNVGAMLYYYPVSTRGGLFLTGGIGLSNYHIDSSPSYDGWGWGFTAGAGFDYPVGRHVALEPLVTYAYGYVGDVNLAGVGTYATGWKQNVVDFGLGLMFH